MNRAVAQSARFLSLPKCVLTATGVVPRKGLDNEQFEPMA